MLGFAGPGSVRWRRRLKRQRIINYNRGVVENTQSPGTGISFVRMLRGCEQEFERLFKVFSPPPGEVE